MDKIPDYSNYTLEQLEDAYSHLNKEKYPDRVNIILEEIKKRKNGIEPVAPQTLKEFEVKEKHLKFISLWEMAVGAVGILSIFQSVAGNLSQYESIHILLLFIIFCIYGFYIVSGIALFKSKPNGIKLCIISQFFQLFKIKLLGFSFLCTAVFHLIFYIDSSFDLGFLFDFPGEYKLAFTTDLTSFKFGVNLISAVILSILFKAKKKSKEI